MDRQELIRIIRRAIQAEKDGNHFYSRAGKIVSDPRGKKMLEQLAKDELYHVHVIEELYHDLLPDAPEDPVRGFPIIDTQDQEVPLPETEAEILRKAIQDEIEARDFYRETAEKFESEEVKEIFWDLMEMEEGHVRLLNAELDFLEQSGFWFDHMEFHVEGEKDG